MGKIKKVNEMSIAKGARKNKISKQIKAFEKEYEIIANPAFDWKEISERAIEEFEKVIGELGGYMYDDPMFEGSDTYGFIVSKKEMDYNAIQKYNDLNEEYMDLQ
jgi:hypothetical protein